MNIRQGIGFILTLLFVSACSISTQEIPLPTPTIPLSVPTPLPVPTQQDQNTHIRDIQGSAHKSPIVGQQVINVGGVVTAIRVDSFYIQDPDPDNDILTSEAILVFTATSPKVNLGDEVRVSGKVDEFIPGGSATGNLSITQIINPEVTITGKPKTSPEPILIGAGGRIPPKDIIEDDKNEIFDPETDGLDFYESLESMLVQVNNAVVVGPTNSYKEIVVLADGGQDSGLRSSRGGIVIRPDDFNPERILIDDLLTILPEVNVGDRFENPIIGVLDYAFGTYRILVRQRLNVIIGNLKAQSVETPSNSEYSFSSFNVQNLDPGDGQKKFNDLAKAIVNNLKSPDILSLEEVQDNNGAIDGLVVNADQTYQLLIKEIQTIGGPKYDFVEIPPEVNQDGGELGGNIRVGFLYRIDRGIILKKIGGGSATQAVDVKLGANGVELTINPGRIEPTDSAFMASRKPLVVEFLINGTKVFCIGVHLNSKGGDTPLFGRFQPPILTSETQRFQQATVINRFILKLLNLDPKVKIILMGDVNDFQFSRTVEKIAGSNFIDLIHTLPEEERYTYIYEGNGQALDHMLVSQPMKEKLSYFTPVHINSEFSVNRRLSDHDPIYARFRLP